MKKADHVMKRSGRANFKKFLKNRNKITYYECGRSGHVTSECYNLKREGFSSKKPKEQKESKEQRERHRGYKAQWDGVENDPKSSKESEKANLCLMEFEDSSHEIIYQPSNSSNCDDDDDCDKLNVIEALNDKSNLFF